MEQLVVTEGPADEQVFVPVVVVVGEQRDADAVEVREARARGHVLEGAVAAIPEQLRLDAVRDEEVVPAVVVVVHGGHAAGAVTDHAERQRRIERRRVRLIEEVDARGVRDVHELRAVARDAFSVNERCRSDANAIAVTCEAHPESCAIDDRPRVA